MKVGIYARISYDPEGDMLGVERQEPPCRELCERKGWTVAEVYVDDDISSYKPKHRPAYEKLLGDAANGYITAIVAWHPDRLTRRPIENEGLIDLVERYGVQIATVKVGDHDLSTPAGRLQFRMLGVLARYEVEHMAERRKLMLEQRARTGLPRYGGVRPFGYQRGGMEIDETEAALIREAVERLLRKGETTYAILRDWRSRELRTPGTKKHPDGKEWSGTTFKAVLTSLRIAGRRSHRGEDIGEAKWPAIITVAEHEQLVRLFSRVPSRGRPPNHLLSKITYCGKCGKLLVSTWPGDGRWQYGCKRSGDRDGCARTFIDGRQLDELITKALLIRLAGPGLAKAIKRAAEDDADSARIAAQVEDDERELDEAARQRFVTHEIDQRRWLVVKEDLERRIAEGRRVLSRQSDIGPLMDLPRTREALDHYWRTASLEQRRSIVLAAIERITIKARAGRRAHFDPARVSVRWRF
jgi:DNA invertase Pin-like site-specific DNA recombinase